MAHTEHLSPEEAKKAKVNRILTVMGILSAITCVEFALALGWPDSMHEQRWLLNFAFLLLTVFKAFYIVADFMHLRHEVKSLMLSIVLPLVFVVWLVVALITEGGAIFSVRFP